LSARRLDRRQIAAVALVLAAVGLLLGVIVIGSTPDDEEFRFAVLSSRLTMRAVAAGAYPFWTSLLGFGSPQPFVPNFNLHPLVPGLAVLSTIAWVRLLLAVHVVIGAAGMWCVGKRLALDPLVIAACAVTFLLSAPLQNYLLSDFWPSHLVVWTSLPWLLLLTWRMLDLDRDARRTCVALGLLVGVVAASTNPGHVVVYLTLGIALVVAHWRAMSARWPCLIAVVAIAATILAPNIVRLATDARLFGAAEGLSNVPDALPATALFDALFRPLSRFEGTRLLWFGGPFFVLAAAGIVLAWRTHLDLVVTVLLSAVLLFGDLVPTPIVSARYQFRDPLTLAAILLAGVALDRLMRRSSTRWIGHAVIATQMAVVTAAAWPRVGHAFEPEGTEAMAFRGATASTPLVDRLESLLPANVRVVYSPRVDHEVAERALLRDGFGLNALAYRGIAVVNGSFKSASTAPIWPDDRLFYGRIRAPQTLLTSGPALDLLGITNVLARREETVASDLRERGAFTTRNGEELVVYENADAWPGAFLVDAAFGDRELPLVDGCENDRFLCRDLASLAQHAVARGVQVRREPGAIDVTWPRTSEPRILVLTEMYRPAWKATSGGRNLATRQMYRALLGVPLPPGTTSVRLQYMPAAQAWATAVSVFVVTSCFVYCVSFVLTGRRRGGGA
jgi:hypothetical protein